MLRCDGLIGRRRMQLVAGGVAAGLMAVGAGSAMAGPQATLGAQTWSTVTSVSGPFQTYNGDPNTVFVASGATLAVGSHYQTRWCTPYGGSQITAATIRRVRFNGLAAMNMRLQDSGGNDIATRDIGGMSDDGVYEDGALFQAPGECVYGGVYQRSSQAMANGPLLLHNELYSVTIEDIQGPEVSGVTTSDWVVGDTAPISWASSDNGLFRGATGARVEGGGTVDLGDPGDGQHGTQVPVGALPDGIGKRICAYRTGSGWATVERCTAFNLDRVPPTAPTIALSPDTGGQWTNQSVTVTIGGATDAGAGVVGYQRNESGAGWIATPTTFTRTENTDVTLQARAIDGVGRGGNVSDAKAVRIDKTPPVVQMKVDEIRPGVVRVSKEGTGDALSGLRRIEVRLHNAQGPVVADTDAELQNIGDAGTPAYKAGKARLVLIAYDNAGNTATATSDPFDFGTKEAGDGSTGTSSIVVYGSTGHARTFQTTDLRIVKQRTRRQVDGRIVPVVRRDYNGQVILTGILRAPDGTTMANEGIELRDSAGRHVQGRRTDIRGAFRFVVKAGIGNRWTVNLVGQQTVRQAVAWFEVRPRVNVSMRITQTSGQNRLVVAGRLVPNVGSHGKSIQLQWADEKGRWRPAVNARVGRNGAIRLVYQFRKPGGYAIRFRVAALADNGWPFMAGTSAVHRLLIR